MKVICCNRLIKHDLAWLVWCSWSHRRMFLTQLHVKIESSIVLSHIWSMLPCDDDCASDVKGQCRRHRDAWYHQSRDCQSAIVAETLDDQCEENLLHLWLPSACIRRQCKKYNLKVIVGIWDPVSPFLASLSKRWYLWSKAMQMSVTSNDEKCKNYHEMNMWCASFLILDQFVIMNQIFKHVFFQYCFDDRVDHIVKVLNDSKRNFLA